MTLHIGSSGSKDPDVMVDINTTPLIDVMLVLLIMLIITIPIQLHSVNLQVPTNSPPPSIPPEVIKINIESDGLVLWNGDPIPNRAILDQKLQALSAQTVQPEIHLRPHKSTAYKNVIAVMASAQRAGLTKIGIIENEQFAP
ncbi:MAG TPA: biopolymer transporter ExbD [Burkholderiales bacterium]|nr:biopolymer transporter ExbD [Burkholderiales bacterium]